MRKAIETKLARLTETCEALNNAGWQGRGGEAVRAALDGMQAKAERCFRILRVRYGVDC